MYIFDWILDIFCAYLIILIDIALKKLINILVHA